MDLTTDRFDLNPSSSSSNHGHGLSTNDSNNNNNGDIDTGNNFEVSTATDRGSGIFSRVWNLKKKKKQKLFASEPDEKQDDTGTSGAMEKLKRFGMWLFL